MDHMKWWGWGDESVAFTHRDKPALAPFIKKLIDLDVDAPAADVIAFDQLDVAPPRAADDLVAGLEKIVGAEHLSQDPKVRVVHTYGKSLRDLLRIRSNDLGRLPDVVVFPANEDEIVEVLRLVLDSDAVLIPFGGGSNIAGSLEAPRDESRAVVSLDMHRLDRVVEIDDDARTARVQAGAYGPDLEAQLKAKGWTFGHFPDSFNHSTLGGWVATRSSGMQSDKYGDIADITKAVRVVTPKGVVQTRSVPSQSTGPSVREMILGSEGRLGVITEVTVQVHRIPEERKILGYLFPNWSTGLRAMQAIAESDAAPSITRVSNANETKFSFATKKDTGKLDELKSAALKVFLERRKGFDVSNMCLSFIGYEGSKSHVDRQRKLVGEAVSAHGGVCIGTSPGELYDQKKFDTPYIRDFLLDRGGLADVSETAAPWSKLEAVYDGAIERANKAFDEIGVKGFIMCHLSHSYHSGACLYFTFAFKKNDERDAIEQYDVVKSAVQQAFIDFGATLSHHHAVGVEHARWLEDDISPAGVSIMGTLFAGVDPNRNLNPGKIVPRS